MIKKILMIFILFMCFSTTAVWAESEILEPPAQCVVYEDGTEQCFKIITPEPTICENYPYPEPEVIYETTNNVDELKRELGANMENKNKNNILYVIIGILSILTLIFGFKAFKKK